MNVTLDRDATNSYLVTVDGFQFTVMTLEGEEFSDDELEALKALINKANED